MWLRSLFFLFLFIAGANDVFSKNQDKKAAIVIDYTRNRKVVFADRADSIRHPASLTKMMTAYLLFEAMRAGRISEFTKFKTSRLASIQMKSKINLKVGEKISVSDLIKAIIVKSANDASVVAAEGLCGNVSAFVKRMNRKAQQLGMKHTHFENPSGVPNKKQVTTARDIATLGMAIYRYFPQYWHHFSNTKFKYKGRTYPAHCKMIKWYKGADGGKTGFINMSMFNLFITAQRYNNKGEPKRVIAVVMGGDTTKSRDMYAASLLDKFFQNYTIASATKAQLRMKKGKIDKVIDKEVLTIDEEIPLSEILSYSIKERQFIDELYEEDDETIDIIDEQIIKAKKKKRKTRS